MAQPYEFIRTVVRIVHSNMIRYSGGSYEISIDLESQDCFGGVAAIDVYYYANDILQAWEILQPLRPGSIHYAEGQFKWNDEKITLMGTVFLPYCGDIDLIGSLFNKYDENKSIQTLQPETLKIVSGCISEVHIENTKDGAAAVILLVERDDYSLIILPELFETYKGEILGGKYLEYRGMPQACSVEIATGDFCTSTIIVTSIEIPILPNEMENADHEQ